MTMDGRFLLKEVWVPAQLYTNKMITQGADDISVEFPGESARTRQPKPRRGLRNHRLCDLLVDKYAENTPAPLITGVVQPQSLL